MFVNAGNFGNVRFMRIIIWTEGVYRSVAHSDKNNQKKARIFFSDLPAEKMWFGRTYIL